MSQLSLIAQPDPKQRESGAELSPCGTYRYQLWRRWGAGETCAFVMLNPSTADALQDDPTIRKCIGFAQKWGFGALVVVNLFAYRATDPAVMKKAADPIGPDNDTHLRAVAEDASRVVCAWGKDGSHMARCWKVLSALSRPGLELLALKINKDGSPAHPLYQPYTAELVPFGSPVPSPSTQHIQPSRQDLSP